VESLARIVLTLLAIALFINVANGTWRQWVAAKFIGAKGGAT
jgi:hypothetical protein